MEYQKVLESMNKENIVVKEEPKETEIQQDKK